jgi:hypothetical protein
MSSSSSFSFCVVTFFSIATRRLFFSRDMAADTFYLQLVLDVELALVKAAEFVDLVLILTANLDLFARRFLVFLR